MSSAVADNTNLLEPVRPPPIRQIIQGVATTSVCRCPMPYRKDHKIFYRSQGQQYNIDPEWGLSAINKFYDPDRA